MFVPCGKFGWTDLAALLELLNLESFLFNVEHRLETIPPDDDIKRLARAIDSESRLQYLSFTTSKINPKIEFYENLLLPLENKSRLKVCVIVDLDSIEFFESIGERLEFDGFVVNGQRLPFAPMIKVNQWNPNDVRMDIYLRSAQKCDIFKSLENNTTLQSLTCDIPMVEYIPIVCEILQQCKNLSYLMLQFGAEVVDLRFELIVFTDSEDSEEEGADYCEGPYTDWTLVEPLFDEIAEENTSIEELCFIQPRDSEGEVCTKLPLIVKSIENNPASRIKTIKCDLRLYHDTIEELYRYEINSRKLVIGDEERYFETFFEDVGGLIAQVVYLWNKCDFVVDRVVLDQVSNLVWMELGKYEYMILSTVTLAVVDGEYCMIFNGER
ncbi:hypothetical protein HK098_003441 [Nowakowskiella sp. JEL0407]|nr:hypothetical protein HK098_003441 [Nowakowskiella sp. JEL0407]